MTNIILIAVLVVLTAILLLLTIQSNTVFDSSRQTAKLQTRKNHQLQAQKP